jgi:RND family efflux transporter MFP subunit
MKIFTRRRIIILIVILVVAGISFYFWKSKQGPKTVQVETVEVTQEQVRETVSASGVVSAENYADLKFLGGGKIARINVKDGDTVTSGQVLATLNSASASQSAKAAKDARDIAMRNRDLFVEQTTDKEDVGGEAAYDIKLRTLNEQISQAQATYNSQLAGISELNIKAPFAGTIVDVTKKEGEPASPTETVIKLADLNGLYFEIDLDQEDFGNTKLDAPAEVELDAYPDETFYGKVIELPQYIDPAAGSELKVKIGLDAKEDKPLLLGMAGDGTIIVNQTSETVQAVPYDAVYTEEDGRTYIWILEDGVLKKKYVEVGIIGDVFTEVKDNLEGLTIVIPSDATVEIAEGDKGQIAKK